MKALTLWQPWASLIALGVKTIETRSWSTNYRGPLAIHAAARKPEVGVANVVRGWGIGYHRITFPDRVDEGYSLARLGEGVARPLPLGVVVATCNLVDVVPMVDVMTGEGAGDHDASAVAVYLLPDGGLELTDRHKWMDDATRMRVVTDQRPYGDFAPNRYAWLLDDIKPITERCPRCWGTGDHEQGWDPIDEAFIDKDIRMPCTRCAGEGVCDPVEARGRQQLWEWAAA